MSDEALENIELLQRARELTVTAIRLAEARKRQMLVSIIQIDKSIENAREKIKEVDNAIINIK